MRLLGLLVISLLVSSACLGQFKTGYPFAGARGGVSSTWLFNKYVSDAGVEAVYVPSWGSNYGINFGYYFKPKLAVELQVIMHNHNQQYQGDTSDAAISTDINYKSKTSLKTIDIIPLFKPGEGLCLEVGPVFTIVYDAGFAYSDGETVDVKDDYKSFNFGACLGFNTEIYLTHRLFLNIGMRAIYGFLDLEGTESRGNTISSLNEATGNDYKTNALMGDFSIGLKYKFRKTGYTH